MIKRTFSLLLALLLCLSLASPVLAGEEEAALNAAPETAVEVTTEAVETEETAEEPAEAAAPEEPAPAADGASEGTLGDNLTWTLSDDGILTISGTGPMADQDTYEHAWPKTAVKVVINEGVTTVGANAFNDFYQLAEVSLPDSLQAIGSRAFANDSSIKGITLPEGVTAIGDQAFRGCGKMAEARLPQTLRSIGAYAFEHCVALNGVHLPEGLESLGASAFSQCYALSDITIPGGVKDISDAFYSSGLQTVTVSEGVESLGQNAFAGCGRLKSIVLPDSVTKIGYSAFWNCGSLESAVLGKGITVIPAIAFMDCHSLTEVTVLGDVTTVENDAFKNCWNLLSIELPDGVKTIGYEAFDSCSQLAKLSLPDGLESIGRHAFYRCRALTELDLPEGLKSIDAYAFEECEHLRRVSIPASVESIGAGAFTSCYELAEASYGGDQAAWSRVDVQTGNAALWDALGFGMENSGVTDYGITWAVADGVLAFGGEGWLSPDTAWTGYADNVKSIVIGEGITDITHDCFSGFTQVADVSLPQSLLCVDEDAFKDCRLLQSVTYPGAQEGWNKITLGTGNDPLLKASDLLYHGAGTVEGFDWDFTDGVFTITGSGTLNNTVHNQIPYQSFIAEQVTKIVFGEGITEILGVPCGYNSLILREICIPKSLTYVGWQVWGNLESYNGPSVTYAGTRDEFFRITFRQGNAQFIHCYDPSVSFNVNDYTVERTWTETVYDGTLRTYSDDELRVVSADGHVLLPGVDYTLSYFDCDGPGTAGLEIIGRTCYSGIKTLHYTILPGAAEWQTENGNRYYYVDGRPVTGLYTIDGALYYFDESGVMQTGWQNVPKQRYYFLEDGRAATGWQEIGGKRYRFDDDGVMLTGWQTVDGERLLFDEETGELRQSMPWTLSADGTLTITGEGAIALPYGWAGKGWQVKRIVIGDGITEIGAEAFYGYAVESVTIPASVQIIGEGAFGVCPNLRQIDLPDGLESIEAHMFEGCSSLQRVSIPASVKSIGFNAFASCAALKTVEHKGTAEQWSEIEIGENNNALLLAHDGRISGKNNDNITWTLTADGTLTVTGRGEITCRSEEPVDFAWRGCYEHVRSIVIEDGITGIGSWAFDNHAWVESVTLPGSLTSIGDWAFAQCQALKTIRFNGTEDEWALVSRNRSNDDLAGVTVYCIDMSKLTPAAAAQYLKEGAGSDAIHLLRRLVGLPAYPAQEPTQKDLAMDLIGEYTDALYEAIGKPNSASYSDSCFILGAQDGLLDYGGFTVQTILYDDGRERIYDVY